MVRVKKLVAIVCDVFGHKLESLSLSKEEESKGYAIRRCGRCKLDVVCLIEREGGSIKLVPFYERCE